MSVLQTTEDLRADALFRAGEPPTSTTGSFWTKSLEYLNRIQQSLVLGGTIAVGRDLATSAGIYAHLVDLPITDWWWARKRGVFNTQAFLEREHGGLTQGTSTSTNITTTVTSDVIGDYVIVEGQSTVYRVANVTVNGLLVHLDAPYVDDDQASGGTLKLAKMEYGLAHDFLRFASTPYIQGVFGNVCDVAALEQRNMDWPLSIMRQGRPTRAFMVKPQTIAFNAYDDRPYRVEYEYIALPEELKEGNYSPLPVHHRSVLSVGAAMLIAFDRGDGRQAQLASEYRELLGRMVQEHRKAIGAGSTTFGQFRCRTPSILRRAPQTFGELYLI